LEKQNDRNAAKKFYKMMDNKMMENFELNDFNVQRF